jgi:hypothetical protein
MSKTYVPQEGSIAWKVIEFFTTNPDETLTTSDLESKFDKPASQFHSLLSSAVASGTLRRYANDEDELVYSMGTGNPYVKPSRARNPSLRPDALLTGATLGFKASSKETPSQKTEFDLTAVQIFEGIPMPTGSASTTDFETLFARMQVNQSCRLPMWLRSKANKACTTAKTAGKGTFTIRKISDEEIGIWRVQ